MRNGLGEPFIDEVPFVLGFIQMREAKNLDVISCEAV